VLLHPRSDHAAKLSDVVDHAVGVKGVKVGDFGGVSLSTTQSATVQVDPPSELVTRLKTWWDANKSSLEVNQLTTGGGGGSGAGSGALTDPTKRKTLAAVEGEGLAHGDDGKGTMFVCKGVLARILVSPQKPTPPAYRACTNSVDSARGPRSCNKKMTLSGGETFTCESCAVMGLPSSEGKWRWILPMRVQDHSGAKMVTAFDEEAEALLGVSADDSVAEFIRFTGANKDGTEGNTEMASAWYDGFRQREKVSKYFTLRAKIDTYNDESRVRLTIFRVRDVEPLTEAKRLLGALKTLAA